MCCIERYGFDPLLKLSEQSIAARWGTKPGETSWVAHAATNDDRIPTGEDMLFIIAVGAIRKLQRGRFSRTFDRCGWDPSRCSSLLNQSGTEGN